MKTLIAPITLSAALLVSACSSETPFGSATAETPASSLSVPKVESELSESDTRIIRANPDSAMRKATEQFLLISTDGLHVTMEDQVTYLTLLQTKNRARHLGSLLALDFDGDGNPLDDIAGMASGLFGKK